MWWVRVDDAVDRSSDYESDPWGAVCSLAVEVEGDEGDVILCGENVARVAVGVGGVRMV